MRVARLLLAVLLILSSSQCLNSQQSTTTPQRDAQALQIAARSQQAMGVYTSVPVPVRGTGLISYSPDEPQGAIEIVCLGPRIFRTSITRGTDSYVYFTNDGQGTASVNGKKISLPYHNTFGQRCPYVPIHTFLGELGAAELQLAAPASGLLDGRTTIILTGTYATPDDEDLAAWATTEIELDAQTFLPIRLRYSLRHAANPQIVSNFEQHYSDYRVSGPLLLPYSIQTFVDGQLQSTIGVTSFEVNPTISAQDLVVR